MVMNVKQSNSPIDFEIGRQQMADSAPQVNTILADKIIDE